MDVGVVSLNECACAIKYFRYRDGIRTETRIGMEGICITHSCIPPY